MGGWMTPACLQRLCSEPSTALEALFLASSAIRLGAHGTEGAEGGGAHLSRFFREKGCVEKRM